MSESTDTIQSSSESYPFSGIELMRLTTYKAAIRAGFFSDLCDELPAFEGLPGPGPKHAAHPLLPLFDWETLQRLEAYRVAVASGLYDDDELGR
jgi:hypothetical protein